MTEVTDEQVLFRLTQQIQQGMPLWDTGISYRLFKAWEHKAGEWYSVDIVDNLMRSYKGLLDSYRGVLYLETRMILALMDDRIQIALDAFNAGHHWRYKGL